MDRIVRQVESSDEYAETREQRVPTAAEGSRTEALARSARYLARDIGASTVVAVSESGFTARKTAMFRPGVPVVATTPSDRVRRQLALSWGVRPVLTEYAHDMETILDNAVDAALDTGGAASGDTLVVLSGMLTEFEGTNTTNTLKVHVAAETLVTGKAVVAGRVAAPVYRTADGDLSEVPEGSIVALGPSFEGEFSGNLDAVAGIVDAREGMTGYPAVVARELGVPMVSGARLPESVTDGTVVTVDGERGVVYDGDVIAATQKR
jgi:pyruvate kinase